MRHRLAGRVLVAALWTLLAAAAIAPSALARTFQGSLTVNPLPAANSYGGAITVTASGTVTEQCSSGVGASYEYCGFYPEVTTVTGAQPCASVITGSNWLGTLYTADTGPGSHPVTANWSEWPSLYSGPKTACLYVSSSDLGDVLVAQATYTVPAPAPAPPVPVPSPVPVPVPVPVQTPTPPPSGGGETSLGVYTMSAASARSYVRRIIRKETSHTPTALDYRCSRLDEGSFRCRPAWVDARWVYSGTLTVSDAGDTISYRFNGLRALRSCMRQTGNKVSKCDQRVRW